MALAIETITQRHQQHINLAQHINNQLSIIDQVVIIIGHHLQEQNVITTIDLVVDRKVKWVKIT